MERSKKISKIIWTIWGSMFLVFDGIVGFTNYSSTYGEKAYLKFLLIVVCAVFFPLLLIAHHYTAQTDMKKMQTIGKLLIAYITIWMVVSVAKLLFL